MLVSLYKAKACEALKSVFNSCDTVSLRELKKKLKRLCDGFHLPGLVKRISASKNDASEVFYSAKTHKPGCPLRVIVSENTQQKEIAIFLQSILDLLVGEDPFRVKNSVEVEFFGKQEGIILDALSMDVKDLYYSIPQAALLKSIEASIGRFGAISFQNKIGIPPASFLALLPFYLCSTYVRWDGCLYLQ